jgi:hypothetical protein
MTDPPHTIVVQTPEKHCKKIGTWGIQNIGKPSKIPMKDGPHQPFKKVGSWRLKAKEDRPELF